MPKMDASSVGPTARAGSESHSIKRGHVSQEGENYGAVNDNLASYLLIICSAISISAVLWRMTDIRNKYVRRIVCMGSSRQKYFTIPSPSITMLKRHLLYVPVFHKRHNREFRLSSAINVGAMPTCFQLIFIAGYLATNASFSVINIPSSATRAETLSMLINRTGVMAVTNMVRQRVMETPLASGQITDLPHTVTPIPPRWQEQSSSSPPRDIFWYIQLNTPLAWPHCCI